MNSYPVVVGITGASGSIMARATVDRLLSMEFPVIATVSRAARMVWQQEIEESFGEAIERWSNMGDFCLYSNSDLAAPISSGTFPTCGMTVIPCSMATVSGIASGSSDNLIRRAADVCLKEKRRLVLVPRETPLNAIHLQNMATLAQMGAVILPPNPAFYLSQQSIDDVVGFVVERVLVALGLREALPEEMRYEGRDIQSLKS